MSGKKGKEDALFPLNINIGIMGHVDSGKTSLVKALSTTLSTASLDKAPQSQARGITLDLGFSSFSVPLPEQLKAAVGDKFDGETLQFTLVDCPGHASLIRTIIGGAQIIDMMVLVMDVNKGIQTQTAECLVIGEITNDKLIVVLNKLDLLPPDSRDDAIAKMSARIRKTLAATKFADAPIIPVAARPGGTPAPSGADGERASGGAEAEAATAMSDADAAAAAEAEAAAAGGESLGLDTLVATLKAQISVPQRNADGPLHFAIDHCFPIKGQGTVLTGTVLSGAVRVGQEIEFPELRQTRKVKSMQMFRQPVQYASQGDRLGLCVTQLDAKALERGIACSAGHIVTVDKVLVAVRQIRFFRARCATRAKFHITVGHMTVMGKATFFGPPDLEAKHGKYMPAESMSAEEREAQTARSIEIARAPLPLAFDFSREWLFQEELHPAAAEQWAVLELETPVSCALPCAVIGSHLDADATANACRLAFHGMLVQSLTDEQFHALRIFKHKLKEGQIERVQDASTLICKNLFTAGTDMNLFMGMTVQLGDDGLVGRIDGTFGKTKFKCVFPDHGLDLAGFTEACRGARLMLRFKRFVFDPQKRMMQT